EFIVEEAADLPVAKKALSDSGKRVQCKRMEQQDEGNTNIMGNESPPWPIGPSTSLPFHRLTPASVHLDQVGVKFPGGPRKGQAGCPGSLFASLGQADPVPFPFLSQSFLLK
ncbi:hypothetical protein JD844_013868, partial [Phrynosoma platyrhinos]